MSTTIQPATATIPIDLPVPTPPTTEASFVTPTSQQIDAFVNNRLDAQDANSQPNAFQIADQLSISPQAKSALEDTLAKQELTLSQNAHGTLTSQQMHYIYNGGVYKAIKSFESGQGSVQDVENALAARGQRIKDVLTGQAPAPVVSPLTPATSPTPVVSPAAPASSPTPVVAPLTPSVPAVVLPAPDAATTSAQ